MDLSTIAPRYRWVRVLAEDRTGCYGLAVDTTLDREVTVRVFGPFNQHDTKRQKRLQRELELVGKLTHPTAPVLYDIHATDSYLIMVFEQIIGGPIGDHLSALHTSAAVEVATKLLGVLAEAHSYSLVHRAVTSDNVFLSPNPDTLGVKLLGWGRLGEVGSTASVTDVDAEPTLNPEWAPEVLFGDTLDARTDVYGVGCVFYRLVTGTTLVERSAKPEDVIRELLRPNRKLVTPDLPPSLSDWLRTCLSLEPDRRFATATLALEALMNAASSRPRRSSHVQLKGIPVCAPGTLIGGKYRVLDELGTGAMGTVFLAQDISIERQVALKLLHELMNENDGRLLREARHLGRVSSPNVVDIYDFGTHEGAPYLVMEFARGRSLEDVFAKTGAMPIVELLPVVAGVGRGLDDIHAAKIVHGDIKPSNVILTDDQAKLLDFGLVQPAVELAERGKLSGSPAYIAPERIRDDLSAEDAHLVDIYAAGVMFFELLTGELPFEGDSIREILEKHVRAPIPRASDFRPELGPEVDSVLAKALSKRPSERYASAGAFSLALGAALERAWRRCEDAIVLIVSPNALRRKTLTIHLRERLKVRSVHEASDLRTAEHAARRQSFDAILVSEVDYDSTTRAGFASSFNSDGDGPSLIVTSDGGLSDERLRASLALAKLRRLRRAAG